MILIFEPHEGGHRNEYIEHIITYVNSESVNYKSVVFCLNKKLIENLKVSFDKINVIEFPEALNTGNRLTLAKKHLRFLNNIIEQSPNFQSILFMNFDLYKWQLLWDKSLRNVMIRGILFQPGYRIKIDSIINLIKTASKLLYRHLLIRLNHNIDKIFILNDIQTVENYNKLAKSVCGKIKFYFLPDPIVIKSNINLKENQILREKLKIDINRTILLVFGGIDERKNLLNILTALSILSKEEQIKYTLIIAGKLVLTNPDEYNLKLEKTKAIAPYLQIITLDNFICEDDKENLFSLSDIVLMPYINFYSSSGVLGHAAKYGKPVIASNVGLINELVHEYNLGITVNSKDYIQISLAIKALKEKIENSTPNINYLFLKNHTPLLFAKHLLN